MSRQPVKVFFPKTRLVELIRRSGGVNSEEAIKSALELVEAVRGVSVEGMENAIAELEKLIPLAEGGRFSADQMRGILLKSERVITLSGTFGYTLLQEVAMRLCDLTSGLIRQDIGDVAPIAVHIRALRLMSPNATPLSQEEYAKVLEELEKVLTHLRCERTVVPPGLSEEGDVSHSAA